MSPLALYQKSVSHSILATNSLDMLSFRTQDVNEKVKVIIDAHALKLAAHYYADLGPNPNMLDKVYKDQAMKGCPLQRIELNYC